MKKVFPIFMLLALYLQAPTAIAQDTDNRSHILSDTELKAAFCLGVTNQQLILGQQSCPAIKSELANEKDIPANLRKTMEGEAADCDTNIENANDKKNKLSTYLFAKGILNGQRGTDAETSFALAISEGETQFKNCIGEPKQQYACYKACRDAGKKDKGCAESCLPEACKSITNCKKLDFLPF